MPSYKSQEEKDSCKYKKCYKTTWDCLQTSFSNGFWLLYLGSALPQYGKLLRNLQYHFIWVNCTKKWGFTVNTLMYVHNVQHLLKQTFLGSWPFTSVISLKLRHFYFLDSVHVLRHVTIKSLQICTIYVTLLSIGLLSLFE